MNKTNVFSNVEIRSEGNSHIGERKGKATKFQKIKGRTEQCGHSVDQFSKEFIKQRKEGCRHALYQPLIIK